MARSYALPALFLPVVAKGFAVPASWWVLPIALTVAWGIGQASATYAWALLGRKDDRSDALMASVSIVVSAALCLVGAVVAWWVLGGNEPSAVMAVGVTVYLAASGILLFRKAEWQLALCMVPAAVGSVLTLRVLPVTISDRAAAWSVVATVALVVVVANRHLLQRRWRRPGLVRSDRLRAVRFMGYGFGCGLLISAFIAFAGALHGNGNSLDLAVWPLLVTLGLMEWQLRSFRSRTTAALGSSTTFIGFTRRAQGAFLRSVGLYVGVLGALSAAGVVMGMDRHAAAVPLLVGCVDSLGVCFFLALLLASSGRVDLVLCCWAATFGVLAAGLAVSFATHGHVSPTAGLASLLAATGTSIFFMSVLSSRVLTSPFSY